MDSQDIKFTMIVGIVVLLLVSILTYGVHLSRLHDEKMVQLGCNQKLISNLVIWDCEKDKQ